MSLPDDNGVVVLTRLLNAIDGRTVRVDVRRPSRATDDDEDRIRRLAREEIEADHNWRRGRR